MTLSDTTYRALEAKRRSEEHVTAEKYGMICKCSKCASDEHAFYEQVKRIQNRRHEVGRSDGYALTWEHMGIFEMPDDVPTVALPTEEAN